jgi:regulatory protein
VPPTSRKRPPRRGFRQRSRPAAGSQGPSRGGVGASDESGGLEGAAEGQASFGLLPDPLAVAECDAYVLLSRRDHAAAELAARLADKGHAAPVVASLVASLLERGYLNDERFAQHYVAAHAARGHGPLRIRRDLEAAGVAGEWLGAVLASGHDWPALALALRRRRFGLKAPASWPEKARQARFLQYRGFSPDHIRSALGAPELDLDPTP